PRRSLQARKAQLAYCLPNRDDDRLRRPFGAADSAHPRLSRRIAADPVSALHAVRAAYCAANCASTSLHAGESCAALVARHCMMRPPPGATPPQIERTSAPQADRSTNSSSRGRIGRSTMTVGAVAAGAAPAAAGAAAAGAAAPPPLAAATALPQAAESFALFFSRHCSAGAPPVG